MTSQLDDALDGMTRRELERLDASIARRLRACTLCGADGALPVLCTAKRHASSRFTLLLCVPCMERHRLPAGRADP